MYSIFDKTLTGWQTYETQEWCQLRVVQNQETKRDQLLAKLLGTLEQAMPEKYHTTRVFSYLSQYISSISKFKCEKII